MHPLSTYLSFSVRQLVEEIISGRDNAKLAQQKLQQYKIDFVKQYKEELKQSMKQALEEVRNPRNSFRLFLAVRSFLQRVD